MVKIGAGEAVRRFGKIQDAVKIPDLVEILRRSYKRFLQEDEAPTKRKCIGLEALFSEIFPIESYDKKMRLEYLHYELERPRYSPIECRQLRLTYGYPLKLWCRLHSKEGEDVTEQGIYLGEMPVMVGGGEFIINGAIRVIVSQLHRSPGVDFLIESKEGDRVLHGGRIIPERGSWIEIGVTRKDVLVVRIDQSSKIPATIFLRAIDPAYSTSEDILRLFYTTKIVPVAELSPTMWVVGPIVDKETGEIIVDAGTQIGDRVTQIEAASSKPEGRITQKMVTEYLLNGLEFKYVSTPDLADADTELKPLLEFIENNLMLEYPDSKKPDEKKRHLPRFNKENDKKNNDARDRKKVEKFRDRWGEEASPEQKKILDACIKKIKDKTPWYSHPEEVKSWLFECLVFNIIRM